MSRRFAPLLATLALLAAGLAAAPAAVAGDPCYHGFEIPPRTEEATTQIKVAPCAFAPTVTHVAVGATVTFFNGPDTFHLVTGANAEWGSRDTELRPGQEISYRFDKAGIYPYACALHRGMSGAIVVGDVAAPAAGGAAAGSSSGGAAAGTSTSTSTSADGTVLPVAIAGGLVAALAGTALLLARRSRPTAI